MDIFTTQKIKRLDFRKMLSGYSRFNGKSPPRNFVCGVKNRFGYSKRSKQALKERDAFEKIRNSHKMNKFWDFYYFHIPEWIAFNYKLKGNHFYYYHSYGNYYAILHYRSL